MIGSLQSLRFIFAIMIFLHHFPVEGKGLFFAGGPCGVSFFMILSGFVMSVGYERKVLSSSFNYISYLKKRLFRLYPLHLLCLIVPFIILINKSFTWYFTPSLLLVQSWIPISGVYFGGNAVAWCLSDMVFFYLCFPILIKKMSIMTKNVLFEIMSVIVLCYILLLIFLPENWIHPILYISPLFRLIDFIIGILLYKLYQYFEECSVNGRITQLSFMIKSIVELTVVLLVVVMLIICPLLPDRFIYASYWWFAMIPLIFLFAILNKSGGVISHILNNKIMVFFGEFSFSFYMIHTLGIGCLTFILDKFNVHLQWPYLLLIMFITIIIVSYFIYNYFEKPIASYLNKKYV